MDVHPAENKVHASRKAQQTIARTGVVVFIMIRNEK